MRKAWIFFGFVAVLGLLWAGSAAQAGGCWGRSPASMAVLNKAWGTSQGIAPTSLAAITGEDAEGSDAPVEPKLLDKPMMIYVTDGEPTEGFDKVEKVVLMDDKVCIAMWAFDCVKITPDAAAKDPILSEAGKEAPRFVFVSRNLKKVDVIEGRKMSAKNVYKTMKKFAASAYTTKLDKSVKGVLKVLGEFDKIANERKVLAQKEARMEKPTKAETKKLEKEIAELDQREKAAKAEREKLLKFELKPVKRAA